MPYGQVPVLRPFRVRIKKPGTLYGLQGVVTHRDPSQHMYWVRLPDNDQTAYIFSSEEIEYIGRETRRGAYNTEFLINVLLMDVFGYIPGVASSYQNRKENI